ncbi:hypothetical protein D3C81_1342770 [compost metagenome]
MHQLDPHAEAFGIQLSVGGHLVQQYQGFYRFVHIIHMLTQALPQLHQLVPQLRSHPHLNGGNGGHRVAYRPGHNLLARLYGAPDNQSLGPLADN